MNRISFSQLVQRIMQGKKFSDFQRPSLIMALADMRKRNWTDAEILKHYGITA